jgi:hypothetical protein
MRTAEYYGLSLNAQMSGWAIYSVELNMRTAELEALDRIGRGRGSDMRRMTLVVVPRSKLQRFGLHPSSAAYEQAIEHWAKQEQKMHERYK